MKKEIESILMDEINFKRASGVDGQVPDKPGLYCIRINYILNLPSTFKDVLIERKHNIIYIGIAAASLKKRFLNQELRAKGHGTFFRSLGAVLGYRPPEGSLCGKTNKKNYKFSKDDESGIIKWINANLIINWYECDDDIEKLEKELIEKHKPLLNLKNNPVAMDELRKLRGECVRIAKYNNSVLN